MIEMEKIELGTLAYWKPKCLDCGWQDEPYPEKLFAHLAAGKHVKGEHYVEKGREV